MTSHIWKVFLALSAGALIYLVFALQGCQHSYMLGVSPWDCNDADVAGAFEECESQIVSTPEIDITEYDDVSDGTPQPAERIETQPAVPDTSDYTPSPPPPPPKAYEKHTYTLLTGRVDIIFVVDNSSSMAVEHRSLASQIEQFLYDIKNVDYHIAVITTDISSSPDNPKQGASYQDGNFIPIGGELFLRNKNLGNNPSKQTVKAFQKAIEREETKACDQELVRQSPQESAPPSGLFAQSMQKAGYTGYSPQDQQNSVSCPSHDERGTYAINLAIRNDRHRGFFRADAHQMFIIISDEDIRSTSEYDNPYFYPFEDFDKPEVLVSSLASLYGPTKHFSFYPIIIPPGHESCLTEQNKNSAGGEGTGRGYYGVQYARLADPPDPQLVDISEGRLLKGEVISICSRDYGSQLSQMAQSANSIKVHLPCANPDYVALSINGERQRLDYTVKAQLLNMNFKSIPLSATITLKVLCELS